MVLAPKLAKVVERYPHPWLRQLNRPEVAWILPETRQSWLLRPILVSQWSRLLHLMERIFAPVQEPNIQSSALFHKAPPQFHWNQRWRSMVGRYLAKLTKWYWLGAWRRGRDATRSRLFRCSKKIGQNVDSRQRIVNSWLKRQNHPVIHTGIFACLSPTIGRNDQLPATREWSSF